MYPVCLYGKVRSFLWTDKEAEVLRETTHTYSIICMLVRTTSVFLGHLTYPFLANWPFPVLDEEWGMCQSDWSSSLELRY